MIANNPKAADSETLASKWLTLVLWLGFSALEIWLLLFGNLKFDHWKAWVIALGAVFFPFMALWSAAELTSDKRLTGALRRGAVAIKWLLAAPFVIVATILIGWLLFAVLGWFASIPLWAAVIIILLLIKK